MATYNVLIMGASYGSLLAIKLLFSGHRVRLICLPAEIEAIVAYIKTIPAPAAAAAPTKAKDSGDAD